MKSDEEDRFSGPFIAGLVLLFLLVMLYLMYQAAIHMAPAEKRLELADVPQPVVRLPLTVHIARNVAVTYDDNLVATWISPDEIRKRVVPEINRIWRRAGIEWVLRDIEIVERDMPIAGEVALSLASYYHRHLLDLPRLVPTYMHEIGARADSYHILAVPLMGRDVGGLAYPNARTVLVADWYVLVPTKSGITSGSRRGIATRRGLARPEKIRLAEPERYRKGSFARNAAHELGHLVGLDHTGCGQYCLMSAPPGYRLSQIEIDTARRTALASPWRLRGP